MQDYINIVEKAKILIAENIEEVTPERVSSHCNYSSRQLSRIFEMVTGATLGEFIRWTRLSKALYEIKYSDKSILEIAIQFKYESQEAFTRIFKNTFDVTPGECRKSDVNINIKANTHLRNIVEEVSHKAADSGLYTKQGVSIWHVVKPARIWISAAINTENKKPHVFYQFCDQKGYMRKTETLTNVISVGGAYLTMVYPPGFAALSWGAEVEFDYNVNELEGFKFFHIPESKYVVFHTQKYPVENHGGSVKSSWNAQRKYQYAEYGLEPNWDIAPVYENDDPDFGYTVWMPVRDVNPSK